MTARGTTGPQRFWSKRRTRVAFAAALVASTVVHGAIFPVGVSPVEVNDVDGEAAIPIELLGAHDLEPEAREEPVAPAAPASEPAEGAGARAAAEASDAGHPDAASLDAGASDAAHDAGASDAALDAHPADAAADGGHGFPDAGGAPDAAPALAMGDAGPHDPDALVSSIQADRVLVMLVVDASVIRKTPEGPAMSRLLRGIPQWAEFTAGTNLDPVRDADWIVISGPSFINTGRDVVLVHYSAPDLVIDRAIAALGHRYAHGGAVDAGVAGVRATRAYADRAERVILRPQTHVLAVVPPSALHNVARQLASARVSAPALHDGEAAFLRFVGPHRALPELPESIEEARVRIAPRDDGGADVRLEGDTKDADTAASAAEAVARFVRRHNDTLTSLVTHGLLDHVEVTTAGTQVRAHLVATRDQISTILALVGDFMGVDVAEPASSSGAPAPLR